MADSLLLQRSNNKNVAVVSYFCKAVRYRRLICWYGGIVGILAIWMLLSFMVTAGSDYSFLSSLDSSLSLMTFVAVTPPAPAAPASSSIHNNYTRDNSWNQTKDKDMSKQQNTKNDSKRLKSDETNKPVHRVAERVQKSTLRDDALETPALERGGEPEQQKPQQKQQNDRPGNRTVTRLTERTILPQWVLEYIAWHNQQLQNLTLDDTKNWKDYRFLVCRCLMKDWPCGGTSDRLQSFPFMLKLAYQTKRLLFYKWLRPCNLEEFLVPNVVPATTTGGGGGGGGINWTVPARLHETWQASNVYYNTRSARPLKDSKRATLKHVYGPASLVTFIYQSKDYGRGWYKKNSASTQEEPSWNVVYSELWRRMFQPSPAVAFVLKQMQQQYGLQPQQQLDNDGNYVAVHVRSHWRGSGGANNTWLLRQALNCSSHLPTTKTPASKIYFAADDLVATQLALHYGRQVQHADMVVSQQQQQQQQHLQPQGVASNVSFSVLWLSNKTTKNPLHLDFNQSLNPADYYDTFVDLYTFINAKCVAYGKGGFGMWSGLINGCSRNYLRGNLCKWNPHMPTTTTTMNNYTTTATTNPHVL